MSLRPQPANWFVTRVPREQTVYALEALAGTGLVELEQEATGAPVLDTPALRSAVEDTGRLAARYRALLPAGRIHDSLVAADPAEAATTARCLVRTWLAGQLRRQRRLSTLRRELDRQHLLIECLEAMGAAGAGLAEFGHRSRFLGKRVYACPVDADESFAGPAGIAETYVGPAHRFHLIAFLPERARNYDLKSRLRHCERVELPDWPDLPSSRWRDRLDAEIARLTDAAAAIEREMAARRADPQLANALNDLAVLRWYLGHRVTLAEDGRHCLVSGWTAVLHPQVLQQALENAGVDAVILFRPAPPDHTPPVHAGSARWANPFRVFTDMMGTPGATELDPAPLLTFIVPLLFGLMFPDVGHGLVLAAAGLVLSRNHRQLRFLVPCGLTAAVMGALFGETFGLHHPIGAILVSPLEQPLFVLLAPLALGVLIILLGLALGGIEARWRGELTQWLWLDAAVLALYLSGMAAIFFRPALILCALFLVHYLIGLLVTCRGRKGTCLGRGIGRLLLSALELVMNTLSFLRVGAFALAHAALSHALIEIAAPVESPTLHLAVLAVGHGAIILIEGLVVFVQTTRLVLFEFFVRFLRADGRLFRPLRAPTSLTDRG